MSPLRVSIACLLLLVVASAALADGKGFASHAATGSVQTADQRALIVRHEDRQTLVIETNLETADDSVAWLIPVPAVPEVTAASDGLFPTLEQLLAPRAYTRIAPVWVLVVPTALLLFLLIVPLPQGRGDRALIIAAFLFVVVILARTLLPALSTARGGGAASIILHARQTVDAYETATLEADSADAVLDWLEQNGYAVPEGVEPVVAEYVDEGWLFVAAKLRQAEGGETLTPAPLALSFEAERSVYPMRLTGVDQHEPLTLELYVLAAGRAEAAGMKSFAAIEAKRPTELVSASNEDFYWPSRDPIPLHHPSLHALTADFADGPLVATRLRGTLSPGQMQQDLPITFKPLHRASRASLYSASAARGWALNAGVVFCCVGMIGVAVCQRVRRIERFPFRATGVIVAISLVVGFAAYQALPRTQGNPVPAILLASDMRQIHQFAQAIADELTEAGEEGTLTAEQIRAIIRESMNELPDQLGALERPRELDAPGHYVVRESGGEIVFAIYDLRAAEHVLWTSDPQQRRSSIAR